MFIIGYIAKENFYKNRELKHLATELNIERNRKNSYQGSEFTYS